MLVLICAILVACSSNGKDRDSNKPNMPDVFGAELHSIEYTVYKEAGEKSAYFTIMSKIDIPEDSEISLEYEGGSFEYSCTITKDNYNIDAYSRYTISFEMNNFVFVEEEISVNKIKIQCDNKEVVDLIPKKFKINYVEGESNNADLLFRGTPVAVPYEMQEFPFELCADKKLILKRIIVSNDSLTYLNKAENTNIAIGNNEQKIDIRFGIADDTLSKYTQYITSIIFVYEIDGKEYVKMTPNAYITYNPLSIYEDNFKLYYNEVLAK